jgi:hypothetical protein
MPMDIIFQGVPMKMRFESQLSRINCQMFSKSLIAFYNKRGNCEQWIKQGKGTIKWRRLSCRPFPANAVRLQLHALAYNLGVETDHRGMVQVDGLDDPPPLSS